MKNKQLICILSIFVFALIILCSCIYLKYQDNNTHILNNNDAGSVINNYDNLDEQLLNKKSIKDYNENDVVNSFDSIYFGSYPQSDIDGNIKELIEWIILDRDEVNNEILVLSKYILDCKCYNINDENTTWETCSLRKWLNNEFYNFAFSDIEKEQIVANDILTKDNFDYGTIGGNNTIDNVFILSFDEIRKYFGMGKKWDNGGYQLNHNLGTLGTNYAKNIDNNGKKLFVANNVVSFTGVDPNWCRGYSDYWTRSPGNKNNYVSFVGFNSFLGTIGTIVNKNDIGVRPAMRLKY